MAERLEKQNEGRRQSECRGTLVLRLIRAVSKFTVFDTARH
jgi:hypothetical protein